MRGNGGFSEEDVRAAAGICTRLVEMIAGAFYTGIALMYLEEAIRKNGTERDLKRFWKTVERLLE